MRAADIKIGEEYAVERGQTMRYWGAYSADMRVKVLEAPTKPFRRYQTGGRWSYTRVLNDIDHGAPNNSALVEVLDQETGETLRYHEDHELAGQAMTTRVFLREIRMPWEDFMQGVKDYKNAQKESKKRKAQEDERRAINQDDLERLQPHLKPYGLRARRMIGAGGLPGILLEATDNSGRTQEQRIGATIEYLIDLINQDPRFMGEDQ